ncbi:ABC transporter ATP-binding protein [Enterococcus gilvus]|uniref:ABC transporter ATP-binding protein/permease n=1 Tax=Enterococcus gilvus ATCC BAA-350 TaxID=1158614 RepID=R2XQF3_9ENTE|nr:ABC transporter ATP-binding protein [Enterococcus gilvus]EOI57099.1 ABC transporter ATP-binding protein/permease [Enterococcus gilvus ATCC BAA-350]EOW83327.1 ABC transporter ATP-binding protein/permease [Enterococcus gilvus ATCC BAA-350]MBS5819719.1 ABC transporter ATP-binding protein [Enterococcus gilvus]OJG42080.1 ABC transporter ATP-binding protein/permease [Enterococcus gilvus]
MFQLLRYAKDYRKQIILGPFFKFLEAVFELILPLFMARLVDEGIAQRDQGKVIELAVAMLGLSIVGLLCALICQYYASIASQGFGTVLRNRLMEKINSFSHNELNRFGTDTLITRMTNDINQMQGALAMLIRLVVRAPFLSIGSVIMSFYIDWQMGIIFLILLPLFCLILFLIIHYSVPLYKVIQQKLDQLNQLVTQNLSGVRVIRAFARTKTETDHFNEETEAISRLNQRVANISALLSPSTTLIMNAGVVALLYFGGFKVNVGNLEQGQVLALINYMNQMLLALIVVSNLVVLFTRAAASAARLNEVFATETTLEDTGTIAQPDEKAPLIDFQAVDFRYTEKSGLALQDITFTLQENKILGITGATGSGKSTLISLIPRFYDASKGTVRFAGSDVKDWHLNNLRSEIALVPQTAVLFSGTIRENLQWGKADATDEECWQALATAQASEFVETLPKGLDTPILENGKNFSGGQRQRLTIARALIRKPKLLILDDSLSALDYQTDLDLRQALKRDLDCGVIIISQRLRSIQDAETILLMDNGKIAAQGPHETLLRESKLYQELVQSQEEGGVAE